MDSILKEWLVLLCKMLPNIKEATILFSDESRTSIFWPDQQGKNPQLEVCAKQALLNGSPVTERVDNQLLLALPVEAGEPAAVALISEGGDEQTIQHLVSWGIAWLDLIVRTQSPDSTNNAVPIIELVRSGIHSSSEQRSKTLVTQLGNQLGAQRVSLGLIEQDQLELKAISHRPSFDGRTNLAGLIEQAMQEAIQKDTAVVFSGDEQVSYPAHTLLREQSGASQLVTVPLSFGNTTGALQIESNSSLNTEEVSAINELTSLIAPMIAHDELSSMRTTDLIKQRVANQSQHLSKWLTSGRLITISAVLFVVVLLGFIPTSYEVRSKAVLEGLQQQSIVAPFNGYVESANAKAGDIVEEQSVLATMDDRDISLEVTRLENEKDEHNRQYRQALADRDLAQSTIHKARMEQAEAKLAQLNRRADQLEIRAPIEGVVVSGDLSRALGAPVEKGDVLFELAPLDAYRVVLHIRESDIDEILEGQQGLVTFTAHPDTKIPFEISSITSVIAATPSEGVIFRTEATIDAEHEFLRPGMEGYARTSIGDRSLAWILFHDAIDWLRLFFWRHTP